MKARIHISSLIVLFSLVGSSCEPAKTPTPLVPSQSPSPAATATIEPTITVSPTPVVADFASDGELEDGWYWLGDIAMDAEAEWTLPDLPPEPQDIGLKLTVLATDANQTRDMDATFLLSYGSFSEAGLELELGRLEVTLPNFSSELDAQGFTCSGNLSLARSTIPSGVTSLWVKAKRSMEVQGGTPATTRLAFRSDSLMVTGGSLPVEMINQSIYQGGEFSSGGDYINGWWWLRDSSHSASATWNFGSIPSGTADLDINLEVLATDRENGGGGFPAIFYISYGPVPDTRPTEQILSAKITLVNVPAADDPNGYTSRGKFTIPRADLPPDTQAIWVRISRADALGQNPIDLHIAFMQSSVTFSEGSTTTQDSQSWQDAITVTNGDYSGSLDFQDTQDWYKLQLAPKDYLEVGLSYPDGADFEFALFDPGLNQVGMPIQDGANQIVQAHIAAADAGGVWYIKIYPPTGTGTYILHIATGSQNEANSGRDAPDTRIPDTAITTGDYSGMLMDDDPVDYYVFDLDPGETTGFALTNAFESTDAWSGSTVFKAEIRSLTGDLLAQVPTQNGTLTITSTNPGAIPVQRYIAVRRDTGRGGSYSLSRTGAGSFSCTGPTQASEFYSSAAAFEDGLWLQDQLNYDDATWIFRSLPSGIGDLEFVAKMSLFYGPAYISGDLQGKFYALYGPIPAQPGGNVFGPVEVSLQTTPDLASLSRLAGWGEFSLPRANLQNASQGFWIRIYLFDPTSGSFWEPVVTALGVSNPAIQLCLGSQMGVTTSAPTAHPQAAVTLNATTQILTSDTPIFVDPATDLDGDGLNQNWENAAADLVNPLLVLSPGEIWLDYRNTMDVANFVRVYPWPSIKNPQYIIFAFLNTWPLDYGSGVRTPLYDYIRESHFGDSEKIFEAWKVLDGNRIALQWVQTSAHYGVTDHSGVWNVSDRQCNVGNISNVNQNLFGTELMCTSLEFEQPGGRLIMYAAEDKHGTYPTSAVCNNARLVYFTDTPFTGEAVYWGETCGFILPIEIIPGLSSDPRYRGKGKWLWTVFNVGEPDNYLINALDTPSEWRGLTDLKKAELTGAFPDEAVWEGYHPEDRSSFCGGMKPDGITLPLLSNFDWPCSTRLGSKFENDVEYVNNGYLSNIPAKYIPATPFTLTEKLRAEFKISIHTTTGMGGSAILQAFNSDGSPFIDTNLRGSFTTGQTDIFYVGMVANNTNRVIDHLVLTQTSSGPPLFGWYVSYIEVTDLIQNTTVTFPVNRIISPNQPVTLAHP